MNKKRYLIIAMLMVISNVANAEIKMDLTVERYSYEISSPSYKEGLYRTYYEDGSSKSEVNFKDYKAEGEFRKYYKSGKAKELASFKDGKQDGISWTYYENGNLKSECHYQNGIIQGICKDYAENGKLVREISYIDGKPYGGPVKIYYDNGNIFQERDGNATLVYSDGKKETHRFDGTLKEYYRNGNLKESESYEDGLKEGYFNEYYENGQLKSRKEYKNDKLISQNLYDENGQKISTGE